VSDPFDKVTRIGPPKKLKPRAQALLDAMIHGSEINATLDRPYLIKDWIERGTISLLFGPSNVGKTFLAIDIAQHVATGREWAGCRVRKSPVLYIGAEAGAGMRNRIAALKGFAATEDLPLPGEGVVLPEFWFLDQSIALRQGSHDAEALAEALGHLAAVHGPFGLVIVDTLARAMGAVDENASRDMAGFLESVETIRRLTGAHIMIIHHTGKNEGQGARGHSSLPAYVDAAIELSQQEGGIIHAEAKKQRDLKRGQVFAYRLKEVQLGIDSDGDRVTTCVVEPDAPARAGRAVQGKAKVAMQALDDALAQSGQVRTAADDMWPSGKSVIEAEWADMCARHSLSGSDDPESQRREFRRQREKLRNQGLVTLIDGYVWRAVK
jgi:RecA-family ATPase